MVRMVRYIFYDKMGTCVIKYAFSFKNIPTRDETLINVIFLLLLILVLGCIVLVNIFSIIL
jgi:hypothetical protein